MDIANALLAGLGISFLIFIHELGHFIAARKFDVRVETFSIGFGPRLLSFRRGETEYCIAAIPLGGYVKMAGEYEDMSENQAIDPRDLLAKPAWQRAIIFSAGVIVNFAFAFVIFPLAFALGVPFTAPVVGVIEPGGAAWRAGLEPGDEVLEINGRTVYGFSDIAIESALGDPDDTTFTVKRGDSVFDAAVRPQRNAAEGRFEAGLRPADDATLRVLPDAPAAAAGLQDGDVVIAIEGETLRPGVPASPLLGEHLLGTGDGTPLRLTVDRNGESIEATIQPKRSFDEETKRLGVWPISTEVVARRGSALERSFPLTEGDVVTAVTDGTREVAVASARELLKALDTFTPGTAALVFLRSESTARADLTAADHASLSAGDVAFSAHMTGRWIRVQPGGAAELAGLRSGDEILALDDKPLEDFAALSEYVRDANSKSYLVRYRRGEVASLTVETKGLPLWDYGLGLGFRNVTVKEDLPGAMKAGWDASINGLRTTWVTVTKVVTGHVGTKNLGGIVGIADVSYKAASWGVAKLLFFLGIVSINLGIVNLLPVPVLDGGQIVYLILEKIKGSRLSDRFMQASQLTGLAMVLLLVFYVTFHDIRRIIG